jgi:hypothetical protein
VRAWSGGVAPLLLFRLLARHPRVYRRFAAEIEVLATAAIDAAAWPPEEAALLAPCDDLHGDSRIGKACWHELKTHVSDERILELTALAGFCRTVARVAGRPQLAPEPFGAPLPGTAANAWLARTGRNRFDRPACNGGYRMYENIYLAIHAIVAPAWLLLAVAPGWVWTHRLVHAALIPLIMAAIYLAFLTAAIGFGQSAPGAGMDSLESVMALFSHPVGLLTGWTHYLVFDLFVGAWIARDAQRTGLGRLVVLPALFLTLMFGPLGLAVYLLTRRLTGRGGWSLSET